MELEITMDIIIIMEIKRLINQFNNLSMDIIEYIGEIYYGVNTIYIPKGCQETDCMLDTKCTNTYCVYAQCSH